MRREHPTELRHLDHLARPSACSSRWGAYSGYSVQEIGALPFSELGSPAAQATESITRSSHAYLASVAQMTQVESHMRTTRGQGRKYCKGARCQHTRSHLSSNIRRNDVLPELPDTLHSRSLLLWLDVLWACARHTTSGADDPLRSTSRKWSHRQLFWLPNPRPRGEAIERHWRRVMQAAGLPFISPYN